MVRACGEMRCNPVVGEGARRLFAAFLSQLPVAAPSLQPFAAIEALLGLAALYGTPAGKRLAAPLRPHRRQLADIAQRTEGWLGRYAEKQRLSSAGEARVREVVVVFAAL